MRDEDRVRLLHMIEAAESAIQFVAGRKSSELDTRRMLLFAPLKSSARRRARFRKKLAPFTVEFPGRPLSVCAIG